MLIETCLRFRAILWQQCSCGLSSLWLFCGNSVHVVYSRYSYTAVTVLQARLHIFVCVCFHTGVI